MVAVDPGRKTRRSILEATTKRPMALIMTSAAVTFADVSRSFGAVDALTSATFNLPAQSVSVLLGPNGAGKTTAIRLITGALESDGGLVTVFGHEPTGPDGEEVRQRSGVVSAKPSLYDRLDGWDNLRYAAELYGLGRGPATRQRMLEAAEQFDIAGALHQRVGGYSTGMKTRLALTRAVLHRPDLLLLDEPTSGLDPESAAAVLDLIKTMTSNGQTVLMSTHLLTEAEGLADHIVVMDGGTVMTTGRPADLALGFWPHPIVRIRAQVGSELDIVAAAPGVVEYQRESATATIALDHPDRIAELVMTLSADGVPLRAVEPYKPTLEDLYFAIRAASVRSRSEASGLPPTAGAELSSPSASFRPSVSTPEPSEPSRTLTATGRRR